MSDKHTLITQSVHSHAIKTSILAWKKHLVNRCTDALSSLYQISSYQQTKRKKCLHEPKKEKKATKKNQSQYYVVTEGKQGSKPQLLSGINNAI